MAKRSNSSSSRRSALSKTHHSPSATRLVLRPSAQLWSPSPTYINPIEDRRVFSPVPRPGPSPKTTRGTSAHLYAPTAKTIGFQAPNHVMQCVRRKSRRQVLFAKKRTRQGARANRRHNFWSKISC